MRIVIDLQGAQSTGSRQRGIGRYSLSIALAIARNRGDHEIFIALNGLFPDTIDSIRTDFEGLIPQENIRVWRAVESVSRNEIDNNWRRKSAELIREIFLANLEPDIVLVTSLFEGLGDDTVSSIALMSNNIATAVIVYDFIPIIYRSIYLENPITESWYENKLDHLRRGNLFLAISESSRQEGIDLLGLPEEALVNISAAVNSQFKPQSISRELEADIRKKYRLNNSYVMYTGGIDHRKNIEGLIRAYASLPKDIRSKHQLAVICSIQPHDKIRLELLAKECLLKSSELVLTGFIPDDDLLVLYALCKVFVFPSLHEGFGLPLLEAMSCGRAVIGSNTSCIPEVIGLDDALFDPKDNQAIADKLLKVLSNDAFRFKLEKHSLKQAKKFSWNKSAIEAIKTLECFYAKNKIDKISFPARRPKLAYVSPLPPTKSGISDYSAELLPELSKYYDIDVIVDQDWISDPWIKANCQIRNTSWFRSHSNRFDRVLYHFGNSHFHQHMFSLLADIPGVVVLHDFFLSGIVAHMDVHGLTPNALASELYKAHGYYAVEKYYQTSDLNDVVMQYPTNISVIRGATGVIVHSENSRKLAKHWYNTTDANSWTVIPLLRVPTFDNDRNEARRSLKISANEFVICSFGLLNPTKLNHRLLNAWLTSNLAKDNNCVLIFVGANDGGEYGYDLLEAIHRSGLSNRIRITGWTDTKTFRNYLAAADIGVQLRTQSRGETSAAVLDCMNYGLPTIINANGSMANLDGNLVCKLEDEFSDKQLQDALETLWDDGRKRINLGKEARNNILNNHAPNTCAAQYFEAIEGYYRDSKLDINALTKAISEIEPLPSNSVDLVLVAEAIDKAIPTKFSLRQLLVDISGLVITDNMDNNQPDIQRILHDLLTIPLTGLRIEPVYASANKGYSYARKYTLEALKCPPDILYDDPIEYQPGDIFLGLDLSSLFVSQQQEFYEQMRQQGVIVEIVVYDQSTGLMPQHFINGVKENLSQWFIAVDESGGANCISKLVEDI